MDCFPPAFFFFFLFWLMLEFWHDNLCDDRYFDIFEKQIYSPSPPVETNMESFNRRVCSCCGAAPCCACGATHLVTKLPPKSSMRVCAVNLPAVLNWHQIHTCTHTHRHAHIYQSDSPFTVTAVTLICVLLRTCWVL